MSYFPASSTRHIEKYQGYLPYHERHHVVTKDSISNAPDRKYHDVQLAPTPLFGQFANKTVHQASFTAVENPPQHSQLQSRKDGSSVAGVNEMNVHSTKHWNTVYRDSFRGWDNMEESKRQVEASQSRYLFRRAANDFQRQFHPEVLQRPRLVPSSKIDYCDPYLRSGVISAETSGVPSSATTRDLFGGTSKGSIRIPGYRGHIPRSAGNRALATQPIIEHGVKNIMAETYMLDLPGYSGFQPAARSAVHRPRLVANMPPPVTGQQTSLLVDGMAASIV